MQRLYVIQEVLLTGKRVNGIKGPTPLTKLRTLNYCRSWIPEYMHAVCLGIIKYLILLWITPKYKAEPWYIGQYLHLINVRLERTKPPYDVTRTPRSFSTIASWKASEFKSFALYYFPILDGFLPEPYFSHFSDFCHGFYVLLLERVSRPTVRAIDSLMRRFVRDTCYLYGEQHVTHNFHLATHLVESNLDWGQQWANSAFIPEWFIGQLQSSANGTQSVIEQMAKNFQIQNVVRNEAIDLIKNEPVPNHVSKLLREMLCLPHLIGVELIKNNKVVDLVDIRFKLIGKPVVRSLSAIEKAALTTNFQQSMLSNGTLADLNDILTRPACFFPRIIHSNGSIFTTSSYVRSKKRINYVCLLENGSFFLIENILYIDACKFDFNKKAFILGRSLGTKSIELYTPLPTSCTTFTTIMGQTSKLQGRSCKLELYLVSQIFKKCVVSFINSMSDSITATALANSLETD